MQVQEYIDRLNAAIDQINQERGRELLKIGVDARALIRSRIINKGELADGKATGQYSDKPVPFFYYFNKSRTGSDVALRRATAQFGPLFSYKQWREVNNLRTDFINLEFTGAMLRDLVPRVESDSGSSTTMVLGPVQDRNKRLYQKHSARFGQSILSLNQDETGLVREANRRRVVKVLNQKGVS